VVVDGGEIVLHATWIADSAIRIVDKAEEFCALLPHLIAFGIDSDLFREIFRCQSGTGLLYNDRQPIVIEQKGCSSLAVRISGNPFIYPDIVELDPQERVQEILGVYLILYRKCGAVFTTQPQLPGDGMESLAELFA